MESNPANRTPAKPTEELETLAQSEELGIAQWQEAEHPRLVLSAQQLIAVYSIGTIATAGCIALGIRESEFNYYLAAVVGLLAMVAITARTKRTTPSLQIILTNQRVIVGKRQHLLHELAGFWFEQDGETIVINIESVKPGIIPITFLYTNSDQAEARTVLEQILPEMEPRMPTTSDQIARYFRF